MRADLPQSHSRFAAEEIEKAVEIATRLQRGRVVSDVQASHYGFTPEVWNDLQSFKRDLYAKTQPEVLTNCRKLRKKLGFIDSWLRLKQGYVMEGLRLGGPGGRKLEELYAGQRPWLRLARDLAREYFTVDNAATSWLTDQGGRMQAPPALPRAVVWDTEAVEYRDSQGVERIRVARNRVADDTDLTTLQQQLARQIQMQSEWVTLGSETEQEMGERFHILSSGKRGSGYGVPGLYGLMFDIAIVEVLRVGDFNGALSTKDVMRQIKLGSDITYGPNAGQPIYRLKSNDITTITSALEKKLGAFDFVTRHDLEVEFPHLDPKFFDSVKYDPVWQRILEWAGPLFRALTAKAGEAGTIAMQAWAKEGEQHRCLLAEGLEAILNDPVYHGGVLAPGEFVKVYFNPLSFCSAKESRERLSFALSNALVSPQTASEMLGFEEDYERERLREARANEEDYRPVFEPKQGLLNQESPAPDPEGGRPPGEGAE